MIRSNVAAAGRKADGSETLSDDEQAGCLVRHSAMYVGAPLSCRREG